MLRWAILGAGVGYLAAGAAWLVYALRTAPRLDAAEGAGNGELGDPADVAAHQAAAVLYARRYAPVGGASDGDDDEAGDGEPDVERIAARTLARLTLGPDGRFGDRLVALRVTGWYPGEVN